MVPRSRLYSELEEPFGGQGSGPSFLLWGLFASWEGAGWPLGIGWEQPGEDTSFPRGSPPGKTRLRPLPELGFQRRSGACQGRCWLPGFRQPVPRKPPAKAETPCHPGDSPQVTEGWAHTRQHSAPASRAGSTPVTRCRYYQQAPTMQQECSLYTPCAQPSWEVSTLSPWD